MRALAALLAPLALSVTCHASPRPVVIRPGQPAEAAYLVQDHSALREIGYDPLCPFTRIADGATMSYTYRFSPGRGHMAYLLLGVATQFLVSASSDAGATWAPVAEMKVHETVGTRTLVDLTPFLRKSDAVLVRFEDRYKEDGWGALLNEMLYYDEGPGEAARLALDDWRLGPRSCPSGQSLAASAEVCFSADLQAPATWAGHDLAVYFPAVLGTPARLTVNGRASSLRRTWDLGYWADVSALLLPGQPNHLELTVKPEGGRVGLWTPVRLGLRLPACAVPAEKALDAQRWRPNRACEPYTPEKMNYLAGNFLQCLYDDRYDLVTFVPGERMPVHFVHDTLRSLIALADEDRFTPVVRLDLARHLYHGCRASLLPGGEYLLPAKHDSRPIDIRPIAKSPNLTLVYKFDNPRTVADIGVSVKSASGDWQALTEYTDSPLVRSAKGWSFTRTWTGSGRSIAARCAYAPGDADTAPVFAFALDGKGPVRVQVGGLARENNWFVPGSWGPEAAVLPDGSETWASERSLSFINPAFRYLLVRGGNSGTYTFCRALLLLWDGGPELLSAPTIAGGPKGKLFSDVALDYRNDRPSSVRLTVLPFDGHPPELKTPRALAENILRTGHLGVGVFDPVTTATSSGLGPGEFAAAAWLFRKYHAPEATEADDLAVKAMRAMVALDQAGTTNIQLFYLINGCEYLHLLGHTEFDPWARTWADRILAMQKPDGSWEWLNFQMRNMIALLRAYDLLGDKRYLDAYNRAVATLEYRDGGLYWKGKLDQGEDFQGATPFACFGHTGRVDLARQALAAKLNYIDDRGFFACSDLNPYMLGFSAKGLGIKPQPKLILGLTDFARYDMSGTERLAFPTAYVVNPHHPLARAIDFPLDAAAD